MTGSFTYYYLYRSATDVEAKVARWSAGTDLRPQPVHRKPLANRLYNFLHQQTVSDRRSYTLNYTPAAHRAGQRPAQLPRYPDAVYLSSRPALLHTLRLKLQLRQISH